MRQTFLERILLGLDRFNLQSVRSRLAASYYDSLPAQFAGLLDDESLDFGVLFQGAVQRAAEDPEAALGVLAADYADSTLLFVPGFLADLLMATDKESLKQEIRKFTIFGTYFDEQMEWLASHTAPAPDFARLAVESQAVPEVNFEIIAEGVRAASRPVLLIAHSKGGIDCLEWLLEENRKKASESLIGKVQGLITIQTPFFGSPIAGYIVANRVLRKLTTRSLEQLGGSPAALESLSRRWRCRFYNRRRDEIAALLKKVPVFCFGSSHPRGPEKNAYPLIETARNVMERMHIPNDGLVPLHSSVLPGAAFVRMEGVDHAAPVMPTRLPFDRRAFLFGLLEVMKEVRKRRPFAGLFARKPHLPECDCYTRS